MQKLPGVCTAALALIMGCGADTRPVDVASTGRFVDQPLEAGRYVAYAVRQPDELDRRELGEDWVVHIDRRRMTATLGDAGADVERAMVAWPRDELPHDCMAGGETLRLEAFRIGEGLAIYGMEFGEPVLVSTCSGGALLLDRPEAGWAGYNSVGVFFERAR